MDYILKDQFLSLGQPKQTNAQYYHWLEKRKIEQEQDEYQLWKKRWNQLEQQQKCNRKSRVRPVTENNCGNCDSTMQTILKPELTYVKNMLWKQTVDQKLNKIRLEQQEQIEREELRHLASQPKQKKMFREAEHKGPIKAWGERFQTYLKKKQTSLEDEKVSFKPNINITSRRITRNMVGRVQNRLITYGEKLKEKKAEMEAEYEQELFCVRNRGYNVSVESDLSDCFYRLYKDGERQNKKRNDQKSQFSFTPQINQLSIEMASRVTTKRKPLYESKINNTEVNLGLDKPKEATKRRCNREASFNDFLKRNEVLLNKQELNRIKKEQEEKAKENRDAKLCTFAPQINSNSKKMVSNRPIQPVQMNSEILGLELANQIPFILNINNEDEYDCLACNEKSYSSKQKMYKLDSDGAIISNKKLQISELQYLAHDFQNSSEERSVSTQKGNWKKSMNFSKDLEPDIFATDRGNQLSGIITEVIEEDSIEKEKEQLWQNQLGIMEQQIEAMMKKAIN